MSDDQLNIQIELIKQQLIDKYQAEKIILFGSAVNGKFTSNSDLDFLIIKDDDKNFHDRIVDVYNLVQKNIATDFIVYTPKEFNKRVKLGDPFIQSIISTGRVIYG